MTRSTAREIAIHCAYAQAFAHQSTKELLEEQLSKETFESWEGEVPLYAEFPNEKQLCYITELVQGVSDHSAELDDYISRYAKGWSFSRIPLTASAIMRVAMYEILYMPEIPNSAAINEAVEIAKKYEEPKVVSFINGILGSFVRAEFPESAQRQKETVSPEEEQQ